MWASDRGNGGPLKEGWCTIWGGHIQSRREREEVEDKERARTHYKSRSYSGVMLIDLGGNPFSSRKKHSKNLTKVALTL